MRLQRAFGVCREDIGGVQRCGLNAGDDGGDGRGEDVLVLGRQGLVVHFWEGCDPLGALVLLVIATSG